MLLTVTLDSEEAQRILFLAWLGAKTPLSDGSNPEFPADKRLLESFRAECESAKGGKL